MDVGKVAADHIEHPEKAEKHRAFLVQRVSDLIFALVVQSVDWRNPGSQPAVCQPFMRVMRTIATSSRSAIAKAQEIVDLIPANTSATFGNKSVSFAQDLDFMGSPTRRTLKMFGVSILWVAKADRTADVGLHLSSFKGHFANTFMAEDTMEVHLRLLVDIPSPDDEIFKQHAPGLTSLCETVFADYL